jgi:hypothetical protein
VSIESVPSFNPYRYYFVNPWWKRAAGIELGDHPFPSQRLPHNSWVVTNGVAGSSCI